MKAIVLTSAAVEQQIAAYHTLSTVFLIVGCVFLVISAALFFLFHIANLFAVKLGIAARRTIREIEDVNSETGRMNVPARRGSRAAGGSGKGSGGNQKWNTAQLDARGTILPPKETMRNQPLASEGSGETSVLETGDHETGVLGVTVSRAVSETSDLKEDAAVQIGRFVITRNIIMIHTQETI